MSAIVNAGWKSTTTRVVKRVQTPPLAITPAEERAFARAFQTLSPHRQQILRLVAEGRTGQEVADHLFISHITVKNTLTIIYDLLGIAAPHKAKRACYLLGRYDQRVMQEGCH